MNGSAWIWSVIIAVGVGTFALRAAGIVVLGKWQQPEWLATALRYVPPAILGALISSGLLLRNHDLEIDTHRLIAASIAAAVAWWRKSLFWTIATGMVALWLLNWGATSFS